MCLEKDLWLPLYRRWSLERAVALAPTLAPRLRTHARAGDAAIRSLLADAGYVLRFIPLSKDEKKFN